MKVKCIRVDGARGLTEGKEYTASKASHTDYWKIMNDNGENKAYHKNRFIPVK